MIDHIFLDTRSYSKLLAGTWVTLHLLFGSTLLGTLVAAVVGSLGLSRRRVVRSLASLYTELGRGVSAIVLLFWLFYAFPILCGLRGGLSPMSAGILALGLTMGAYGAEIVRGALASIDREQWDAATAVHLTRAQALRSIILPQALGVLLPPFGNLVIENLKATAVVSLIAISDLAFEVQKLRVTALVAAHPVTTVALYVNVLVIYFVLAQVIAASFRGLQYATERRFGIVGRPARSPARDLAAVTR